MKSRIAIYTAVIGDYDRLPAHKVIFPEADYYCFVGKGEKQMESFGPWKVLEADVDERNPKLVSAYIKTHPHVLLPGYDYTLWVDANIGIVQSGLFGVIQEKMASGIALSGMRHPETDCAYEEAVRVVHKGKERIWKVLRLIRFLRRSAFPKHDGLFETGVLLRRGDAAVRSLDENWWRLIKGISCRDQLSFPYCMRQAGFEWDTLIPAGADVRNHPFFAYRQHAAPPPRRSFLYRKSRGPILALIRWYAEH